MIILALKLAYFAGFQIDQRGVYAESFRYANIIAIYIDIDFKFFSFKPAVADLVGDPFKLGNFAMRLIAEASAR